jgi:hypothetical protein
MVFGGHRWGMNLSLSREALRDSHRILVPACPVGSCPYASMRAMSVHLPAHSRAVRCRRLGGTPCTMSDANRKPLLRNQINHHARSVAVLTD